MSENKSEPNFFRTVFVAILANVMVIGLYIVIALLMVAYFPFEEVNTVSCYNSLCTIDETLTSSSSGPEIFFETMEFDGGFCTAETLQCRTKEEDYFCEIIFSSDPQQQPKIFCHETINPRELFAHLSNKPLVVRSGWENIQNRGKNSF